LSEHVAEVYQRIPLGAITPSPYQYRKSFGALDELAASIKTRGVLQPIRVRSREPNAFELVVGERRWRASKLAGMDDIPAMVVVLTDDQVIEEQLLENLQRADVHPLEEGEHYQQLLTKHGYTLEQLIEKTKRSRSYLYSRMKLTALAPACKKALQDGRLVPAIAELLGRIADHKLQERACKEVLGEGGWESYDAAGAQPETLMASDGSAKEVMQPLSYRAAAQLLRRRYTLRLELAKFNPHDVDLTPAGACTSCAHRSGNQPELPGVGGSKDDLCVNPPCFEAKTKASWERQAKIARDSGLTVIEGKAAKELFDHNDAVSPSSPYVDPKAELPPNLAKPGSKATWAKLLGKLLPQVPFVVVQDPSGAARELLDRDAATKLLREVGKVERTSSPTPPSSQKKPAPGKSPGGGAGEAAAPRPGKTIGQHIDDQELAEAALEIVLELVANSAADDPGRKELAWWRWIARQVIALHSGGTADLVGQRRGVRTFEALTEEVEKARTAGAIRALIIEIFMCADGASVHVDGISDREAKERFEEGLRLFGGPSWEKALTAAKTIADGQKADAKPTKKGGAR